MNHFELMKRILVVVVIGLAIAAFLLYRSSVKPPAPTTPAKVAEQPRKELAKEEVAMRPVPTISMEQVHENLKKDKSIVFLDVRTPEEYAAKSIPGTLLVPIDRQDASDFMVKVAQAIPDKNTTVYVFCRSGNRSGMAARKMLEMGYQHVYNAGGINEWKYGFNSGKQE